MYRPRGVIRAPNNGKDKIMTKTDMELVTQHLAHLYRLPCAQKNATDAWSIGYKAALSDVAQALKVARKSMVQS
jgi:hypothetical protein